MNFAEGRGIAQYQEPELTDLTRQAIADNLDHRQAVARITEFRARAAAARADLRPTLTRVVDTPPRTRSGDADENRL